MSLISGLYQRVIHSANLAYNYVLPHSMWEYTKSAGYAVCRLVKDLTIDLASIGELVARSVASGIPAGIKSAGNLLKAIGWDLPKAVYYKYFKKSKSDKEVALKEANENLSCAGNQMVEAVSTSVNTAYEGIKPILAHAGTSILWNGGEAVLEVGAATSIATIEGLKLTYNYGVVPIATATAISASYISADLYERASQTITTLEQLAIAKASDAYNTLPRLDALLTKFSMQSTARVVTAPEEIEMSVRPSIRVAPAA